MLGQKFGNQRVLEVGSAFIKLVRDFKFYIEEQLRLLVLTSWMKTYMGYAVESRPKSLRYPTWEFDL